jgi:hypothetical protein
MARTLLRTELIGHPKIFLLRGRRGHRSLNRFYRPIILNSGVTKFVNNVSLSNDLRRRQPQKNSPLSGCDAPISHAVGNTISVCMAQAIIYDWRSDWGNALPKNRMEAT